SSCNTGGGYVVTEDPELPIPGGGEEPPPEEEESESACGCPNGNPNKKVAIMHRPPGNEANEHVICVARPGADNHLRRHNDYVVCEGN
ncbi:MAG: hypothetical protein HKN04_11705, partial [Rhodothermaceae bacterium]|nr:hypothetical protein [Rhodothermaceae bacterium]